MANDKLSEQSMDFAVHIINLVKQLKEQRESIILFWSPNAGLYELCSLPPLIPQRRISDENS